MLTGNVESREWSLSGTYGGRAVEQRTARVRRADYCPGN